jgi:hypothetical protein
VVAHAYNPSTWEPEAGGWRVSGQPGLLSETPTSRKKRNKNVRYGGQHSILPVYFTEVKDLLNLKILLEFKNLLRANGI